MGSFNASRCIGHVGGLAVALGAGAAIWSGTALAAADTGSADSARSSATSAATGSGARAGSAHSGNGVSAARRAAKVDSSQAVATPPAVAAATPPAMASAIANLNNDDPAPRLVSVGNRDYRGSSARIERSRAEIPPMALTSREAHEPIAPYAAGLAMTAILQVALNLAITVADIAPSSPLTATPTLKLNGYNLVPSSTETIRSFYGRWTYLPGAPSLVQGSQKFDVVDPETNQPAGSFDALVSRGDGYNYMTLLVTANDGTNVGTEAGQTPPVGSLISKFRLGPIGWTYTAMPAETGDVVSFKLTTPFGDIPLPIAFDAAAGIADHTFDNRPVRFANGYSFAPADPTAEIITGTSGVPPFFTAVQGNQTFNVYDPDGATVGSFDGLFTTTSDILGNYTQAVLVTSNDGTNVGTEPGQVPPVGSVYNVCYTGTDTNYLLYSSLPSQSGDVISFIDVSPQRVWNGDYLPLMNASQPPALESLSAPGGRSFVPISPVIPAGINGLPPREVEIQGFRRFAVYDSDGVQIGSFDSDVETQWDMLGIHTEAVMVTHVTEGTAGTGDGDVPPVGSVFNYVFFGNSGFGTVQSVIPGPTDDLISFKLLTPLGVVPLYSLRKPATNRTDVHFADPFLP